MIEPTPLPKPANSDPQDRKPTPVSPPPAQLPAPAMPWHLRLLRHLLAIIILAATFGGTFALYVCDNDMPIAWHPDEMGKVQQVLSEGSNRNFNHPQLLLEGTLLWQRWFQTPADSFSTVLAGRHTSAVFGAATATLLAAAAYLAAGLPGLLFGALALGLCPQLLTYSHYMKEDTALAVGIAAVVCASRWVWNTKRWGSRFPAWLALGAACALAASGKYVGAGTIALAVLVILFAPAWRWWSLPFRLLLVTAALLAVALTINYRTLNPDGFDWQALRQGDWQSAFDPRFVDGLERETDHSLSDHRGITADKPNTYVLATAIRQCPWHILVLAGALPVLLVAGRRYGWGWQTLLIVFAAGFTYLVSFTVILFARYTLPTVLLLHLLAALSAGRMVQLLAGSRWLQAVLILALANVFILMQLPQTLDFARQFHDDSREKAKAWLIANLPPNASVYEDEYAALATASRQYGSLQSHRRDVRLYSTFTVADCGSVQSLSGQGECFVVISSLLYDRFLEPRNRPADDFRGRYAHAVSFYRDLLEKRTPIWECVEKYPQDAFTSPDIRVYRLKSGR